MKIFMENKHKIAKHNAKYAQGLVPFKLNVNKYADMVRIFRFYIKFIKENNKKVKYSIIIYSILASP